MPREAGGRSLPRTVMGAPGLADPATGTPRSTGGLPAWRRAFPAAPRERSEGPVAAAAPAAAAEALVRQAAQGAAGEGGGPHEAFPTARADRDGGPGREVL